MINGTGKKIEEFGATGGDICEQYYLNEEFEKEIKVSSVKYSRKG